MYLVYMTGVYIQSIIGVFDTEIQAKEACRIMKLEEEDDYHDFWYVEIEINGFCCLPKIGVGTKYYTQ